MKDDDNFGAIDLIIAIICTFLCWIIPTFIYGFAYPESVECSVESCEASPMSHSNSISIVSSEIVEYAELPKHRFKVSADSENWTCSCPMYEGINISDEDADILAACLYLECRGESRECQRAICSVILNRCDAKGCSISEVIFAPNQFSTASSIASVDLSLAVVQYEIIDEVRMYGKSIPDHVYYFRAGDYHTLSDAEDYMHIDNTYFSSSKKLLKKFGLLEE